MGRVLFYYLWESKGKQYKKLLCIGHIPKDAKFCSYSKRDKMLPYIQLNSKLLFHIWNTLVSLTHWNFCYVHEPEKTKKCKAMHQFDGK